MSSVLNGFREVAPHIMYSLRGPLRRTVRSVEGLAPGPSRQMLLCEVRLERNASSWGSGIFTPRSETESEGL